MTDYFALLGEARQPWLDEETLKANFYALSTEVHPDRVHALAEAERKIAQERYTELNAAYNCLREPKERLRHLLQLETGRKPAQVQQVPAELIDVFFEIGEVTRTADEFLKRKAAVTSPLLLVDLFDEDQNISERLAALRDRLSARRAQLLDELRELNTHWQKALDRIEYIQQAVAYLQRWGAQLQERIFQLRL